MNLYLYCLSDEATPRDLEGVEGVAAGRAELIEFERIKAVVSGFEGGHAALTRENVFAHERVLSCLLKRTTPLPFRFGVIAGAESLDQYIRSHREHLEKLLDRVRGAVEMNIKVIWDTKTAKGAAPAPDLQSLGPGTAYLESRRRAIERDLSLKEKAEAVTVWLKDCVGDAARESVVEVYPSEAMVIRAAYLVERARLDVYLARVSRARRERQDLSFLTSGAWPPYSFTGLCS